MLQPPPCVPVVMVMVVVVGFLRSHVAQSLVLKVAAFFCGFLDRLNPLLHHAASKDYGQHPGRQSTSQRALHAGAGWPRTGLKRAFIDRHWSKNDVENNCRTR